MTPFNITTGIIATQTAGYVVPGTTGFSINTSGIITLSGTPTHSGATLAHEILNDLEVSFFYDQNAVPVVTSTASHNFIFNETGTNNSWIFEIGAAKDGAIIELVGITNVDGFAFGATASAGNQVHVI